MTTHHVYGLDSVPAEARGCVLTVGNFDGVHAGHRHILETARALADAEDARVAVMTFDPPPDLVLRPADTPRRLSLPDARAELLLSAGADNVVTARTDRAILALTPEQFVDDVLVAKFAPRHIIEGENFFFGARRAGNVDRLRAFGKSREFIVHVVEPVLLELDGRPEQVSSTLIRSLLSAGRIDQANRCLMRPYELLGRVVPGRGRGRQLGFPTCNVDSGDMLIPGDGIFAGYATADGVSHPAAISIGSRVTFADGRRAVEAHLLDTSGDFYDKEMTVTFITRVRDQQRFSDGNELSARIAQDLETIRDILAR